MLAQFALLRRIARLISFSYFFLPSSKNCFTLGDFNCHHFLWDTKGTSNPMGRKYLISSFLLTSYLSMIPTPHFFFIASLAVAPLLTSPLFPLLFLLGGALGLEFCSPINSTNCPSFSALSLPCAIPSPQFSRSLFG